MCKPSAFIHGNWQVKGVSGYWFSEPCNKNIADYIETNGQRLAHLIWLSICFEFLDSMIFAHHSTPVSDVRESEILLGPFFEGHKVDIFLQKAVWRCRESKYIKVTCSDQNLTAQIWDRDGCFNRDSFFYM